MLEREILNKAQITNKKNSLRGFQSTSRLFDDAIVLFKTISTLEGYE